MSAAPPPEAVEGSSREPEVDLIIAVHTVERPIERAVGSVLADAHTPARVLVVCHGVSVDAIAARLGPLADDPRVRLLPFVDGIASPTGPFNHGLDAATSRFTAVMGSDDELERGAVDSWLAIARRDGADIVIPRLLLASGASMRTPPTRPFRSRGLDGARDRLAYRTAQLGLVARERFADLRFTTGISSGEDIAYGLRLWFSGAPISFDRRGPAYLIHSDATDRTTFTRRSVAHDFTFLDEAIDPAWVSTLPPSSRTAIAVKLLRTHLLDALRSRLLHVDDPESLSTDDRASFAEVVRRILAVAPNAADIVSRRDRRILRALVAEPFDVAVIAAELRGRGSLVHPSNSMSAELRHTLHREAPPRFFAAIKLAP